MSINPVLGALPGLVLLHQHLALHEWVGILIVAGTYTVAVLAAARRRRAADGPECAQE